MEATTKLSSLAIDPAKIDKAGLAADIKANVAAGRFDLFQTDEEIKFAVALLAAKNYADNGALLLQFYALRQVRQMCQEVGAEIETAIIAQEHEARGRRQGVESAVNLRGIIDEIKGVKAKADRIEKTTVETAHAAAALVQHLPDATKPTVITMAEAVTIMKAKGGEATERTIRNWVKAGRTAKTSTAITWNDLATIQAWSAWVDTYLAALNSRITSRKLCSEYAAKVEAEKTRRRSPTA